MTDQEQTAVMRLALMAALADGRTELTERAEVAKVAESLSGGGVNVAAAYQDVQLKRVSLEEAAGALTTPETRRRAERGAHDGRRLRMQRSGRD